jgi:hypothetical protein
MFNTNATLVPGTCRPICRLWTVHIELGRQSKYMSSGSSLRTVLKSIVTVSLGSLHHELCGIWGPDRVLESFIAMIEIISFALPCAIPEPKSSA